MSYFDDASLVMIPSGYKDQKVYSVKPLDGSGDLTFSRASSATRVASNGLIEKVRTNLITYSQAFDNAAWTKGGVGTYTSAVTTGFTDPTGGTNAQRWLATIATTSDRAFVRQLLTLTNGIPYNVSFWIKSNTASAQELYVQFQGGAVATVTATTSWTRVSYTQTTSVTSVFVGVDAKELATDVLIYGYQVEVGDIATDYIATTSAAVSVGPVSGLPRLDYLNSTCPRLLLEPQRSNIATYSEQFDNAAWSKYQATITANAIASPDGSVNADKFLDSTANDGHALYAAYTISGDTTFSIFVKSAEYTRFAAENLSDGGSVIFNLSTATVVSTSANYKNAKIENYGNGWYRLAATTNGVTGGKALGWSLVNNSGNIVFAGTGTNGVYVWGAQVEVGAYATSYIPTLGTSVTRAADMSGTTDYFGAQTFAGDFTFFVDLLPMEGNTGTGDAMILGGGDYTGGGNFQSYFRFASGNIILRGVAEALLIERNYAMTANQQYKILVTRTGTTVKIFANGAQVGASATSSTSVILRSLGWSYIQAAYNYDGRINQVLLMPSGLTDAQAIELTTL